MSVSKTYIAISIVHFRTHFHLAQNVQSRVLWKINKPTVNRQEEKDLSLVRKMDGAQTQRMIANVKLLVHHQKSNFPILKKVFSHQTSIFYRSVWILWPSTFVRINTPALDKSLRPFVRECRDHSFSLV